jgi:hypothetical protein
MSSEPNKPTAAAIQKAFISVADRESLHGKWIPILYWSFLVNKELNLTTKLKESKLFKAIESIIGPALPSGEYGTITGIQYTESRIKRRRTSSVISLTKKQYFLSIETANTKADALPSSSSD